MTSKSGIKNIVFYLSKPNYDLKIKIDNIIFENRKTNQFIDICKKYLNNTEFMVCDI